jgi:hypothetical protein
VSRVSIPGSCSLATRRTATWKPQESAWLRRICLLLSLTCEACMLRGQALISHQHGVLSSSPHIPAFCTSSYPRQVMVASNSIQFQQLGFWFFLRSGIKCRLIHYLSTQSCDYGGRPSRAHDLDIRTPDRHIIVIGARAGSSRAQALTSSTLRPLFS